MYEKPTEVEGLGRREEELAHQTDSSLFGQLEVMPHVVRGSSSKKKMFEELLYKVLRCEWTSTERRKDEPWLPLPSTASFSIIPVIHMSKMILLNFSAINQSYAPPPPPSIN